MEVIYQEAKIYKIILNADEFISICKGDKTNDPEYSHFYEKGRIQMLNSDNSISNGEERNCVVLRNIEVNGLVRLIGDSITYPPINISGCTFNDTFQIHNGTFENLSIGLNPGENIFNNGLKILGGNFENDANISSVGSSNSITPSKVEIHGGKYAGKLRIWGAKNCDLSISKGVFKGGLSLAGNFYDIKISGGAYESNIELESLFCENSIQFIGDAKSIVRTTNKEQEWVNEEFPKFIKFENSGIIIHGEIIVLKSFILNYVNPDFFKFSIPSKNHNIFCFINDLKFVEFNNDVQISSRNDLKILINSLTFENCTVLRNSLVRLDNLNTSKLRFISHITLGDFIISNIKGRNHYTPNYNNYYKNEYYINIKNFLKKTDIKEQISEITVKTSDLGKTIFFNCNMVDFQFIFESSKISEIFLAGTQMPNKIKSENIQDIKNGYGQIKKAYQNGGDTIASNEFSVYEINAFHQLLKVNKSNKTDRIILCLNQLSSNHSQDWFKAFKWIISISIISYLLLLLSVGIRLDFVNGSYETFLSLSAYFFSYLNPLHKTNFLHSLGITNWNFITEFIDSITRFLNAYLIYQFIQAFRKFSKK